MSRKKFTGASATGSSKNKSQLRAEQQVNAGGELHQNAGGQHLTLTTNQGVPLSDNQNSLKANPRGPALLEDFILREKITHFDHERIPERIVHARATGVHGFFEQLCVRARKVEGQLQGHSDTGRPWIYELC